MTETSTAAERPLRAEPDPDAHARILEAAGALDDVFRAADIRVSYAQVHNEDERIPFISLSRIDAPTAIELVRRIQRSMKPLFHAAEALQAAFVAQGLDLSKPSVHRGRITLGDVSVATANRLACLLGAPPQEECVDLEEWPEATQVADRLGAAFKGATGGGFLDPRFHAECRRCHRDAEISLGDIDVRSARRLARALRSGA